MSNPRRSQFDTMLNGRFLAVEYTAIHGEVTIESVQNEHRREVQVSDGEHRILAGLAAEYAQMDRDDAHADEMERRAEQRRDDARDGSRP